MDNNKKIKIKLTFRDEKKPYLIDISSLLYDLELLHDFSLLIYMDEYREYKFTQYFWYRKGRPLKSKHKIRAIRIIKESPLTIELIFGGIAAFWGLVQAIERIMNWRLNRQKLKLEVEKLERELKMVNIELERRLYERQAWETFNSLLRRLESNPIKLEDIEVIDIIKEDDNDENFRR
ncbi:MAG: hypothetical protein PWR13_1072 [Archaeoglobi archaeon]|nr:hypothetical protein [Archaeoglobi archaeon]